MIVTVTKAEQVRQAILLRILSSQLLPGERLLEAKLAKELGVSQATVNAALQDLHNQGLVTKLLNRSTNVSVYQATDIEKLFAVRMLLEPAAAEEASRCWSEEGRERLREQVDQMRRAARARSLARFCLADYTFHQEVYKLSGNPFLIQACQAIAAAPFAFMLCNHVEPLPTDYLALAEDHQDMVLAMEDGPEAAGAVMRERIGVWKEHSVRALSVLAAGR